MNYNREEPTDKKNRGSSIKNEKPIAVPQCQVDMKLGQKRGVSRVEFLTPEQEQSRDLEFEQHSGHLRFRVPEFLVYGVVRIQLAKSN